MLESIAMFFIVFGIVLALAFALNHYGGGFAFVVHPFNPCDDGRKDWKL